MAAATTAVMTAATDGSSQPAATAGAIRNAIAPRATTFTKAAATRAATASGGDEHLDTFGGNVGGNASRAGRAREARGDLW